MDIIQDNVMIELESIGEGWSGDYNEDDPEDEELLRFTVYVDESRKDEVFCEPAFDNWYAVSDGSYCTRLPNSLSNEQKEQALRILMQEVLHALDSDESVKKACEYLSWMEPADL